MRLLLISIGLSSLLFACEDTCSIKNQNANCTPVVKKEAGVAELLAVEKKAEKKAGSKARKPQSQKPLRVESAQ